MLLLSTTLLLYCCLFVAGRAVKKLSDQQVSTNSERSIFGRIAASDPDSQASLLRDDNARLRLELPRTGEHIIVEGHNVSLGRYLWSGRTGEYYEVPGGWPGWQGDVVAKEFYIWYWPHELARELKYLSRAGQLVAHDKYDGVQWLIMHKPPGVHLTKTRAFKEAYQKGRKECDDLVEKAYEPAFNAIIDFIRKYGIFHHVLNSRMLWDEEAKQVALFDFGDDTERDPKAADDQDVKNEIALNIYVAWPNDGISYQDWCVNGQAQ